MEAAPEGRTHIYEVVNHLRKESLLVLCPEEPESFQRRLGPPRPGPIVHWAPADELNVEQIAASMAVADAEEFLTMFLESVKSKDWRMISWRP